MKNHLSFVNFSKIWKYDRTRTTSCIDVFDICINIYIYIHWSLRDCVWGHDSFLEDPHIPPWIESQTISNSSKGQMIASSSRKVSNAVHFRLRAPCHHSRSIGDLGIKHYRGSDPPSTSIARWQAQLLLLVKKKIRIENPQTRVNGI